MSLKISAVLFLTFFLQLPLFTIGYTQMPDTAWVQEFYGVHNDYGVSVRQTFDEGYILAFTRSTYRIRLIKTNSFGDTMWTKTYNSGNAEDYVYSVQQISDSGFVLVGSTKINDADYQIYIIRTNQNGDTIWTRQYGSSGFDEGFAIQQISDSGFIITGRSSSTSGFDDDVMIFRTSQNGDSLWLHRYGGGYDEAAYYVNEISGGEFIIAGNIASSVYDTDVWILKTNDLGDTLRTKMIGDSDFNKCYSARIADDGGLIIIGYTDHPNNPDILLIKTDQNSDTVWTKTYGGLDNDIGYSVIEVNNGGYLLAGRSESFGNLYNRFWLLRTKDLGDTLWTTILSGSNFSYGNAIQRTSDYGFIISGIGTDSTDHIWLLKLFPESGSNVRNYIYSQITKFNLYQNYPNPFNPATTIRYSIPKSERVTITVYNILGQKIRTLISQKQSVGDHQVIWDGRDDGGHEVASGVFIYQLRAGEYVDVKKMVLMR